VTEDPYLASHLQVHLAEAVQELDIDIDVLPTAVIVRGTVATEERRRRVLDVVREHAGELEVVSEMRLSELAVQGEQEELR
jgi:hypothetical protein